MCVRGFIYSKCSNRVSSVTWHFSGRISCSNMSVISRLQSFFDSKSVRVTATEDTTKRVLELNPNAYGCGPGPTSTIYPICPSYKDWHTVVFLLHHEPIRSSLNEVIGAINMDHFVGYEWQMNAFFNWFQWFYQYISSYCKLTESMCPSSQQFEHTGSDSSAYRTSLFHKLKSVRALNTNSTKWVSSEASKALVSRLRVMLSDVRSLVFPVFEFIEAHSDKLRGIWTIENSAVRQELMMVFLGDEIGATYLCSMWHDLHRWATPNVIEIFHKILSLSSRKVLRRGYPGYLRTVRRDVKTMMSETEPLYLDSENGMGHDDIF